MLLWVLWCLLLVMKPSDLLIKAKRMQNLESSISVTYTQPINIFVMFYTWIDDKEDIIIIWIILKKLGVTITLVLISLQNKNKINQPNFVAILAEC